MFQVLFCVFLKRFTRIWNKLLFALVVLNICLEIRVYVLNVWAWKVSKFIAEDLIWVRSGGMPGWAEKRRNYEHHTLCWFVLKAEIVVVGGSVKNRHSSFEWANILLNMSDTLVINAAGKCWSHSFFGQFYDYSEFWEGLFCDFIGKLASFQSTENPF